MTNPIKEKIIKEFEKNNVDELSRHLKNPESSGSLQRKKNLEWLSHALDRYAREVIDKIMPETFQNIPIPERPSLYEDKAWLGWNACRLEMQKRADELLDKE